MPRILRLLAFACVLPIAAIAQKNIPIIYSAPQGSFKKVLGVNAGPDSAVRAYKEMRMDMVRIHDYYGPGDYHAYAPGFYDAATKTFNASFNPLDSLQYNFASTDNKINHIVSNGFTPFFRLGISYPNNANVPTMPPANIATDPNFTRFASICAQTVRHYTKGWNKGFTHAIPYWEIWNEPNLNLFWSGANASPINFFRMYKSVADSIKAVNPNLKVGTPGLAYIGILMRQPAYYDSLISICSRNGVPMDFYSWHLYECYNPYAIKAYGDTVRQLLRKYNYNNAESFITEINPKLEGDTAYNDKPKGAAYAASVLLMTQDSEVDRIFWYRGLQLGKLAKTDTLGAARLAWNGYPFKAFGQLLANCKTRLSSPGNELVTSHLQTDTTNFMVISGKSITGDTVEVMVSNLKSAHSTINIALKEVTWPASQAVGVSHTRIQAGAENVTGTTTWDGWANQYTITNAAAPSVHYLRFTKCAVPKPAVTKDGAGDLVSSAASGNQWYKDGSPIAGATGKTYKPTLAGNYTVQVSIDGCSNTSDAYAYVPTSVLQLEDGQFLKVYPNPAYAEVRVEFRLNALSRVSLALFDMNGARVATRSGLSSGGSLPLNGLPGGSYLLKVYRENGMPIHQTVLLKR